MRRLLVVLGLLLLGGGALLAETGPVGPMLMLLGCVCVTVVFLIGSASEARAEDRRARAAGILAAARVLTVRRTDRSYDDTHLYEVTLLVSVPGRARYTATVIDTISWWYTTEGNIIPVTVSVTDPHRIWIEYPPAFPDFRPDQF